MDHKNKNTRIHFLDTSRVIAVLLVSFGHIILCGVSEGDTLTRFFGEATKGSYPILSHFNTKFINFNYFIGTAGTGVCLFFLITGYIIPLALLKTKGGVVDFLIARFFRIFPPALLVLIVVHIFLILTFKIDFNFTDFFKSYLNQLLPGIIDNNNVFHSFEPFWTLSIEIIFYILIAFAGKTINFWSVVLMQIMFVLFYIRTKFACFGFIVFILFGSLFLFIETEFKKENKITKKLISQILLSCIILMICFRINKAIPVYPQITFNYSLLIFFGLYFTHLLKFSVPKFIKGVVNVIADFSYSFYLLHVPVGMGFAVFLKIHYNITNPYIQVFAALVLCFVMSYICSTFFEKPSTKFGKFLIKKFETKKI